uniref:Uncharacterized protein n=1 Tax=Manihot esculenta TaxID=3983 RepID=A0A2C9V4Z8_MANES
MPGYGISLPYQRMNIVNMVGFLMVQFCGSQVQVDLIFKLPSLIICALFDNLNGKIVVFSRKTRSNDHFNWDIINVSGIN